MAKLLRLRRGTDVQHTTFTGAEGEVTVNTTNDSLHVHDGSTAGGHELARADLSNLPAGTIDNADISSSAAIANSKLATSGVTAGTYGSSSAIPAITVNDRGIVTSATTSAIDSTAITNGTSNVSVAASGDITVTRAGSTAMTFTGDGPLLPDGQELRFGTGADFRISHTGADTILSDVGTGDVYIRNDNTVFIQNAAGTETKAAFISNGSAILYYDNYQKLSTTSGGIDVIGSVTCTGLTVNGNGTINGVGTIQNSTGVLVLRDNDNNDADTAQNYVEARTADGTARWRLGDLTSTGHVYFTNMTPNSVIFQTDNTTRCSINNQGHFLPDANNTYDLGTTSYRWRNVYTNDLNLSNEGGANDVDGTWGSWTIQEGEDELFLLNRRNGKKYKFNLSEVN